MSAPATPTSSIDNLGAHSWNTKSILKHISQQQGSINAKHEDDLGHMEQLRDFIRRKNDLDLEHSKGLEKLCKTCGVFTSNGGAGGGKRKSMMSLDQLSIVPAAKVSGASVGTDSSPYKNLLTNWVFELEKLAKLKAVVCARVAAQKAATVKKV
jgi:hypothetical protein